MPQRLRHDVFGGRGEIRTHGGREPSTVFKTVALNRSATLPESAHYSKQLVIWKRYSRKKYIIKAKFCQITDAHGVKYAK